MKTKDYMRTRFEGWLLLAAAWIMDRNVQRSAVISRRDNNWLFDAAFEVRGIAQRILHDYEDRMSITTTKGP